MEDVKTEKGVLEKLEEKITLKTEKRDFKEFFKDREGLWVWSDFEERILAKAEAIEDKEFNLSSFKLLKYANDKEIENALPEKHLFSESEVCAVVAELISKQSKGEEGTLLNNGYANLFYTPSFVVSVGWHSGGRGWGVDAWRRDGRGWGAGPRVFSPATEL